MTVAELMVNCLVNEGVQYVFGVPGEETEDLLFALANHSEIEFVPCRHEQGAAFIANVWGRITGKAGVCLSTLGPGATNLMTGVADANLDKAPLVAITGQGGTKRLHQESHQNLNLLNTFAPITKWNASINTPEITAEVVRKAFKLAEIEKSGATHIELPEDIANIELEHPIPVLKPREVLKPAPNEEAMRETLRLINAAGFPLILAGNGALRNGCSEALRLLVQYTNIPLVSTFMGKGAISDELPQSLFTVGLGFKDTVMKAFEKADLIIAVGYDIAEYAPDNWNPEGKKKIIHLDYEAAEVYQHYQPQVEMIGDVATSVQKIYNQLTGGLKYKDMDSWYEEIRAEILEDILSYELASDAPDFTVPGVLHLLRKHMNEKALLVSDVGTHKMWIARNFRTFSPNACIISNGLASMGIALPGAIAGALIDKDRQVVGVAGDGGFMMNIQELATAVQLDLSMTLVVLNDNDYGLISWKQERSEGRSTGTRLNNPNFVQLAESFGVEANKPSSVNELEELIQSSLNQKGIQLIVVPVDPSVNDKLKS
ncbi:MAG: acetolactate synthase large subunit [Saprospiraceae bacterium]